MEKEIIAIFKQFNIDGDLYSITPIYNGLINTTFEVEFSSDKKIQKYLLQKINTFVFKQPTEVMENIIAVTKHINKKIKKEGEDTSRKTLNFKYSKENEPFVVDDFGNYWRACDFIDNSITFNETSNLSIIEETGKAFGNFLGLLNDFPAKNLNIIIPHFHNTPNRFENFKTAIMNNLSGRADSVLYEIEEYLKLEDMASKMYRMQKNGDLKLKVTHNDTKCNNVLFDKKTNKYLCVIDLDTVMPGLTGFDFGDAIRFIANTSSEDEVDLSKVEVDIDKFKAFTDGFLQKVGNKITKQEKDTLVLGAITMTIECGVRFLTDYLNGDVYFKTAHKNHNLDRARCQLKLANSMIKNKTLMDEIVNDLLNSPQKI